jgi:hypothetical protein
MESQQLEFPRLAPMVGCGKKVRDVVLIDNAVHIHYFKLKRP